jgi:hypothetical protein
MTRPATAALVLILAAAPRAARAQSVTAEVDVLAGRSTEDVNAAAIQIRLFGATKSDWRFYAEAVWGLTSGGDSDAFGAAYPYDKRVRAMEAFTEKTLHPGGWIVGVRAGRYRTPFGMYGRGDHAYTGFTRAPLIRYGENWALSNNLLEGGAAVLVGRPALALEAKTPSAGGRVRASCSAPRATSDRSSSAPVRCDRARAIRDASSKAA